MLKAEDYVRLFDQDLADATKALEQARKLLLRSRLRMVNLATAVREDDLGRPLLDSLRLISEDLKRAAPVPSMESRSPLFQRPGGKIVRVYNVKAACRAGRHEGQKRGCLNGHCCGCLCHRKQARKRGKKKSKKSA